MLQPIGHFVDISHWDAGGIDFHAYVAGGAKIIILKASEGRYADPDFLALLTRARTVPGLQTGSYVYIDAVPADSQVSVYLSTAHLQKGDVQPIVDAEALGLTAQETEDALTDLTLRGYSPILYCSLAFWQGTLDSVMRWKLWLAAYRTDLPALPEGVKLWAWQHGDAVTLPGISHTADGSYLYAADPATYTI